MALSYSFDPTKGETPQSVAQSRATAQALAARIFGRAPANVGEGLNAIGQALIARQMMGEAGDAQKAGQATIPSWLGGTASPSDGLASADLTGSAPAPGLASPQTGKIYSQDELNPIDVASNSQPTTGKIYSNNEPSPLDPPSGADRQAMIQTILGEAGNEPQLGKNAVASVIRTRAVDGGYGGDTPTGVVTAPNQFEPWNTQAGRTRMASAAANPQQAAAADAAIASAYGEGGKAPEDPTQGMTHFYSPGGQAALGRSAPAWAGGESVTIGGHVFNSPDDAAPGAKPPVQMASNDPAALPPNAQPAQGALPTAQAVQAATQPAALSGPTTQQLMQAASNPWLNEGQRAAVTTMLKQRLEQEQQAADPLRQLQIKKAQSDLDKGPTSVQEYEYAKAEAAKTGKPFNMDYPTWSVAKARAGAISISNVGNVGAENKGLNEAAKLDAEAVRKGQNEKMPALDDADHNFQMMQDAIDRNGGKLPTGGVLGKLGLDARRTSNYIRDNWGIDLGDDPTTAVSLETFNKGGIKASGDMAKAIGGNRVLKVEFDLAQRANPGLETTDGGNKYLIDLNRNTIAIQKDHLQAQEDYWRSHNHSLDGFQKSWNTEVKANPRPLSTFSVAPPVDNGDGSQMVKLPSTAQGGYSWYRKGQDGLQVVADKDVASRLDDSAKPLKTTAAPVTKVIGGKTYVRQDGNWFEQH